MENLCLLITYWPEEKFLNHKYGTHAEVKATRGDTHDYLGMTLIFQDGELIMNMVEYVVKNMLEEFPIKFKENETVANPEITY